MTLKSESASADTFPARNWRRRTTRNPKNIGTLIVLEEYLVTSDTRNSAIDGPNDIASFPNIDVSSNIFEVLEGSSGVTFSGPASSNLVIRNYESFSQCNLILLSQYPGATNPAGTATFQFCRRPFSTAQSFSGQLVASNISNAMTGAYGSFPVTNQAASPFITNPISGSLSIESHDHADAPVTYLETVHSSMGRDYVAVTTVLPYEVTIDRKQLEYAIKSVFNIDPMPEFEGGVNNAFSDGIEHVVRKYGNEGVEELRKVFCSTQNISCVGEALRKFGLIENETTMDERFRTLVALLKHWSPVVRDAATIGLAYLDDPRAIAPIEEAIQTERVPVLRREMEAAREQLAHR
jgi:hypothetical protein